jgi:hypothetical protein
MSMESNLKPSRRVGLGATGATGDLDAGGVDDQVVNAVVGKEAMEPEGVPAGFVAAQDGSVVGKSEALSGQADLAEERGEVGGGDGALTGRLSQAGAEEELPGAIGKLEGQVEHLGRWAILGCVGRCCAHGFLHIRQD